MTGDDRVRFCELCNLHVYNIAELTRFEAQTLVATTEGRICARLYRRTDGTVITKDCPVGLRALRRRAARTASAVFATLMSLIGVVAAGQKPTGDKSSCTKQVTINRKTAQAINAFSGVIQDPNGAVLARTNIEITNRQTRQKSRAKSDAEGRFLVQAISPGSYNILVKSPGFKDLSVKDMKIADNEVIDLEMIVAVDGEVLVGVIGVEPLIDTTSAGKTIIISGEMLRRLPHR
jgi:carboxypeptidase family protein